MINPLIFTIIFVSVIAILAYYIAFVIVFSDEEFETKKEVHYALIPFYMWIMFFVKIYRKLD